MRNCQIGICLVLLMLGWCIKANAQTISSTELINNAKLFDGKLVVYSGEIIGDVMVRGNSAWINVNDGANAIGIWLNAAMIRGVIDYTGSYKSIGDSIEFTGIFHRACPEHGGDMDLHAQGVRRLSCGGSVMNVPSSKKRNFIIFLLGVFAVLWIFTRSKRS